MKNFSFFSRTATGLTFLLSVLYSQPNIQLDKTKIELGTIYQGEIKNVKLIVRNAGSLPLIISRVETSCGCTSAKRSVPTLAPAASDTIEVSFNSLGFDGKITKTVTVQSNDPVKPFVDATITGIVTTDLETVPKMQFINFGSAIVGSKSTITVLFRNTSKEQLMIKNVAFADTTVSVQIPIKSIAPSDTAKVLFTYTPRSTSLVNEIFYVETNSLHQPRVPFRFMYTGR